MLVELNRVEAALFKADYAVAERHVLTACRFMKPFELTVSILGEMGQLDYAPLRVALRDASGIQSARATARKEVVKDHFWLFRPQLKHRGLDCLVVLANPVEFAGECRLLQAFKTLGKAQHRPPRRSGVLGPAAAPVQPVPRLDGRPPRRPLPPARRPQPPGHALRHRGRGPPGGSAAGPQAVRRDFAYGALFVNRQAGGPSAGLADHNRTYAVDGRWGVGDNGLVSGFYGGTNTPGLTGRDHALRVSGTYTSEVWRLAAGYRENGEDFNPEVGFASSTGFRSYDLLAQSTLRPRRVLRELQPRLAYTRFWNFDGVDTGNGTASMRPRDGPRGCRWHRSRSDDTYRELQ